MRPSQQLESIALKYPKTASFAVRGACSVAIRRRRKPHWLLRRLKDVLGVQLAYSLEIDGFRIEADPLDALGCRLQKEGLTEPETLLVFQELLQPGMTVLDIGAYIGQFSLVAARAMEGRGRILSFEPTPTIFPLLKRNLEVNASCVAQAMQCALSDREGTANFYVRIGSNDQSSVHALDKDESVTYQVPLTTVDRIAERFAIKLIDVVKIDVEGNELAVLHGARRVLAVHRPALIIEISRHQRAVGYSGARIKSFLDDAGYASFRLHASGRVPYQPREDEINAAVSHFNILALPKSNA